MHAADPLPCCVETTVAAFLRHSDRAQLPTIRGLYLVGSVALDDYRSGASDIDFVAVLDQEPTPGECKMLAGAHTALMEAGGPRFDGVYLTVEALRRAPADYAVVPFSLDGRFRTGETCREVNPAVWRCLARHGRAVLGPPPSELGIADDGEVLRAYQVGNLRTYWSTWIEQAEAALAVKPPGEGASAIALAWGVLGVARIACALETDRVVSKSGGGRYALVAHPIRWHPVICGALTAHRSDLERVPVKTFRDGLAYMREAIAAATEHAIVWDDRT
ncbi:MULTISPECIES: aminoglycoside adenylyltransferase domain-containing protein [unclassified Methylobacterium]|uniref:aminoglycoside adenylyltransferase domain-containing protein n=1 Tax=unclassified Methylobacterium TaxID=2615210 RepID=UPI003701E008